MTVSAKVDHNAGYAGLLQGFIQRKINCQFGAMLMILTGVVF